MLAAVGGAIPLSGWMAYNASITGSPLHTPFAEQFDELAPGSYGIGFGGARGQVFGMVARQVDFEHGQGATATLGPGHSPTKGLLDQSLGLQALGHESLGWGIHAFAPALLLLVLPAARRRWFAVAAATALVLTFVAYAAFWYAGVGFGARFYFELFPALVALNVLGLTAAVRAIGPRGIGAVAAFVAVQVLWSIWSMTAGAAFEPYRNVRGHDRARYDAIAAQVDAEYPDQSVIVFVPTAVSRVSAPAVVIDGGSVALLAAPIASLEQANFGLWRNRLPLAGNRVLWAIDWDRIAQTPERREWIIGPRQDGGQPLIASGRWPQNVDVRDTFAGRVAVRPAVGVDGKVVLERLW
jgi:hypothetical protein